MHPDGRGKARFFLSHGFGRSEWEGLAKALLRHAAVHPASRTVETQFGIRYVIDGALESPDGRRPVVRAIWFVRVDTRTPEPVTAYPVGRRSQQ
jgi:hypothetical protein